MNPNTKRCLETHLPDKAKPGTVVPAKAWFDAATAHLRSARAIMDFDPSGAATLAWAAMHKTAKAIAALGGCRIEDETHGKVVDFLLCVYPEMSDMEKGLVRATSKGRNVANYDDPRDVDPRLAIAGLALAERILDASRDQTPIAPAPRRIPPPPPKN